MTHATLRLPLHRSRSRSRCERIRQPAWPNGADAGAIGREHYARPHQRLLFGCLASCSARPLGAVSLRMSSSHRIASHRSNGTIASQRPRARPRPRRLGRRQRVCVLRLWPGLARGTSRARRDSCVAAFARSLEAARGRRQHDCPECACARRKGRSSQNARNL